MRKLAYVSVWLFVFAIPWENSIFFPGIGTASRMFGLWAFFFGLAAIVVLKQEVRLHLLHWFIFCFILCGGFSYFWSIDPTATLHRLWTYLQLFIMVWLVYQCAPKARDLNTLLVAYVLGAYISAINTVVNYLRGDMVNWQRYAALGFNPNDISIILSLGIPMAWYLSQIKWGGHFKWVFFFYPFLAPIAIALTGSRSGMIAALIALSYLIWTQHRLSIALKLALLAGGAAAAWLGMTFVPPESWTRLATTGSELTEGSWNTRLVIWEAGFEAFTKNPLLGAGAGVFRPAVEAILGTAKASHNVYLAILVEQGLVGFALFALILITALYSALRMPKLERSLWLVILLAWGVSAFAHPWEWRKQTWLLFALVVTHAVAWKQGEKSQPCEALATVEP